jgi:hypothetical protein
MVDTKNIDLLLAKLHLRQGRKEDARKMLDEQLQSAVDLLQDHVSWNDRDGYDSLGRLLFINGQLENAKVAVSLRRYLYSGYELPPAEEDTSGQPTSVEKGLKADEISAAQAEFICSSWHFCESQMTIPFNATMYTCTTCVNVDFCERCYNNLRNRSGQKRFYVCNPNHDFVRSPAEGLEKVETVGDETMTVNGKTISFADWLAHVRKEWRRGVCFQ